jgi:hypothetical protein
MNIDRWPEMWVVHPESINQSLEEALDLGTIQ